MSKGDTFENDLLKLIFQNVDASLIGDATGLRGSTAPGFLYVSLHTGASDPGENMAQTTNEISYTNYSRIGVTRTSGAWTVTNNTVVPAAAITFPASGGGAGGTIQWFAVGASSTGAGKVLYRGTVSPNISVTSGVTPQLTTATQISED
jgi:hypothetical protein